MASQPTLFDDDAIDLAQVAVRLRVGVRRVRQLVWAGERPGTAPDRAGAGRRPGWSGGRRRRRSARRCRRGFGGCRTGGPGRRVVTANLTRTVTGRWQALYARPLYDHARPAGTLYQAHLRHLLTRRLGVRWEPVARGWAEVAGVPQPVIRAFSKRRAEIEQMVAESGYASARAHQTATLATRQAKEYGVEPGTLLQRWREEAEALGFGADQVVACLDSASAAADPVDEERLFAELAGPGGLTRQASTFHRKEVVEAVAERVADRADSPKVEQLVDSFLASGEAVALAGGRDRVMRRTGNLEREPDLVTWSTPELVTKEADLITWAAADAHHTGDRAGDGVDAETVEEVLVAHPGLSDEHTAMVRALADPTAGPILTVAGRPAAGRTTATAVYVQALTATRQPGVGCALAATAAGESKPPAASVPPPAGPPRPSPASSWRPTGHRSPPGPRSSSTKRPWSAPETSTASPSTPAGPAAGSSSSVTLTSTGRSRSAASSAT